MEHEIASLAKPTLKQARGKPLGEPVIRNVVQEIIPQDTGDIAPIKEVRVRFLKEFVELVRSFGPNHACQFEEWHNAQRRVPNVGIVRQLFLFASSKGVEMNQRVDGGGRERIVVLDGLVHIVMVVIHSLFEGLLHGELALFDRISFIHV